MPENTAIKTNNYAVMPVSFLMGLATVAMIFLKGLGFISVPWIIVFSPVLIWLGIMLTAGLFFVALLSVVAMIQIWR